jgi:hypothetical protein
LRDRRSLVEWRAFCDHSWRFQSEAVIINTSEGGFSVM